MNEFGRASAAYWKAQEITDPSPKHDIKIPRTAQKQEQKQEPFWVRWLIDKPAPRPEHHPMRLWS